jgi:hypothetical protein
MNGAISLLPLHAIMAWTAFLYHVSTTVYIKGSTTMKTETVVAYKMIVHIYQTRLRHISEDNTVTITVIGSKACSTHG